MSALHFDAAEILVAIPMVCGLFFAFFRLDELYGRHGKPGECGHALSDWDEHGSPLCIEPDGAIHRRRKGMASAPGGQARKVSTFLEPL